MIGVSILYLAGLTVRSMMLAAIVGLLLFRCRKAHVRHAVWTVLLVALCLMPLADAILPPTLVPAAVPEVVVPIKTLIVSIPMVQADPIPSVASASAVPLRPSPQFTTFTTWVNAGITFLFLLRFALTVRGVSQVRKASRAISHRAWDRMMASKRRLSQRCSLRESNAIAVPLTVGVFRPLVILPAEWRGWDDWTMEAVLTHELTHVERWDWAITCVAALAKCLYWFNPLVWWIEKELALLAEQASDEACVRSTGDRQRYAETLLHFAVAAKHGHRWIGGVAMAQHKITLRIDRVLALQTAGSGVLRHAAWFALLLAAVPALYVSAATQSEKTVVPSVPLVELQQLIQPPTLVPVSPSTQPVLAPLPPQQVSLPQAPAPVVETIRFPVTQQVVPVTPVPPVRPANPDLVGEIRLILAPVDRSLTGPAANNAPPLVLRSSFLPASFWNAGNAFAFSVAGIEGRKVLFEDGTGATFSYGCAGCVFLVWESGIGSPSNNAGPGVLFRLGADGKSVSATCRASECRVAPGNSIGPLVGGYVALRDSETRSFGLSTPGGVCFSVFGNVKADGTPFTDADCPSGNRLGPSPLIFSINR